MTERIFIGTSNISLPGNKLSFPKKFQDKSRLHYYSSLFNSLEVNSSFYKTPLPSTFTKWSLDTATEFQFSVKLTRDITHVKKLAAGVEGIEKFILAANELQQKRGCLLVQFPGKITLDYFSTVEQILTAVADAGARDPWRVAVEFRHASWYVSETMEMLDEYKASVVMHDIPGSKNQEVNKKAPFVYYRFHGPAGDYRGSYDSAFLHDTAKDIKKWTAEGKTVFAYFNNTIGSAYDNALLLKKFTRS